MNKYLFFVIWCFFQSGFGFSKSNDVYIQNIIYPSELKQLHQNIVEYLLKKPVDDDKIGSLLDRLDENGRWPDIDYTSESRAAWSPINHLSCLYSMTLAYQSIDSRFYLNKSLLSKILLALNDWLDNDYQNENWWYPQIGIPKELAPTMILLEAELSPQQISAGLKIFNRAQFGLTGQNRVWLAGNVMLKALLDKDVGTVKEAARQIQEELVVSVGEGIQADWSYHQHGAQIQFGNYGLAYVNDMIKWISLFDRTPFEFEKSRVAILRNYLLEGLCWITWKERMDISSCGRQLFPGSQLDKGSSFLKLVKRMEVIDPDFANEYKEAGDYSTLTGNKHFWRSDYHIQRTKDYYFSVKMCSERVIGAESCNLDNILGYYLGDGATYLYQSGDEYLDIFPYWDWKKIPGTTTHQDNGTLPILTSRGYHNGSDFVGGVSDGKNGIATMDYDRDGLTAHKSWFMFEDKIVCLGADINSTKGICVVTTLNQSLLKGDIEFDSIVYSGDTRGDKSQTCNWLIHDSIGYFFPKATEVHIDAGLKSGSWNWVAKRFPEKISEAEIFTAWLDHGANPVDQSYSYILIPGASREKMEELQANSAFKIINTNEKQEVATKSGDLIGIVFYKAGKSDALGGFEVSDPCIVMIKKTGEKTFLSIAEPSHNFYRVRITFDSIISLKDARYENGQTVINIILPQGSMAGKTLTLEIPAQNL